MTRILRYLFALILILVSFDVARAQVTTGAPPFGSFSGGPDVINLGNLNAQVAVPMFHKAGRGTNFTYDLSYDTSVWYPATVNGVLTWQPVYNWGWRAQTETALGYVSAQATLVNRCLNAGRQVIGYDYLYANWTYHDSFGATHPFSGSVKVETGQCAPGTSGFTSTALDDAGYTIVVSATATFTLTGRTGKIFNIPFQVGTGAASSTDRNGNQVTADNSGNFFDTLSSTTPVLTAAGSGTPGSPMTFTYTAPSGAGAKFTVNYTNYTVATNFGISGTAEYKSTAAVPLITSIAQPDGSQYTFSYEATPSAPASGACTPYSGTTCTTARLASVTLPTGGTISYQYYGFTGCTTGNNGVFSDGSASCLKRTTPDGTWTYTRTLGSGNLSTTLVTAPITPPDTQSNQTLYNFSGIYETQMQAYQGSTSSTLLQTHVICYNGNFSNCTGSTVTQPITSRWDYRYFPNLANPAISGTFYDAYGNLTEDREFDYVPSSNGVPFLTDTGIVYASLGNGIVNMPQTITVTDNSGNVLSKTTNTYDQGTVSASSGTPQHVAITGSRGNLTTTSSLVQGSTSLNKTFTYYDTGEVNTATDVNGAVTTYSYSGTSCGNAFPTSVSEPLSLSKSFAWNCTGGVQTSVTDENSQVTSIVYSDPYFWRPASTKDATNATTNITYPTSTTSESVLSISSSSAVDVYTTLDGLGRIHLQQRRQAPGSTNFDTVETDYDSLGRIARVTQPYQGTAGQTNSSAPATTTTYDALSRPTLVTDPGSGTAAYSYPQNDAFITVGPLTSGEHLKERQLQYDGLGRITSVCEITSLTGSGTCGQNSSATGYWTKYGYGPGNVVTVTQNAQAGSGSQQTRTYNYDDVGRLTSETNPESGTTTYTYDIIPSGCYAAGTAQAGDLTQRQDPAGDNNCFIYDSLHRVTSVGSRTGCKRFAYDNTTFLASRPSGITVTNALGRMNEAETDNCGAWPPTPITDEWFNYTARGEVLYVYELTPHSGGYYPVATSYFPNGPVSGLIGANGYSMTWGVDGEGRISSAGSSGPLTSTTYNAASQPTQLNFSTGDSDSFAYDNAGRMKQYNYTVNGQTLTGNPTWNANGTLGSLLITDPFNAANTQNCTYSHDDLVRISSVNCGASTWQQNFAYDPFGNITKTVPTGGTGMNFAATYSPTTNHILTVATANATYDANGDVTNDSIHTYTWDGYGNATTIDGIGIIYDAFDRMVEQNRSSGNTEFIYAPTGFKMQIMNGQTSTFDFVPLPGGDSVVYSASSVYYRHADWLGSSRFATTTSRTVRYDGAYAPFGEPYAQSGTLDLSFTGMDSDTSAGLYDFLYREYSTQGRWPQPDPGGLTAVDLSNPQSWNRYAYVANNPLAFIDPLGLLIGANCDSDFVVCVFAGDPGGGSGGDPSGGDPCFLYGLNCGGQGSGSGGPCYYALANPCGGGGGARGTGAGSNGPKTGGFTLGVRAPGQTFGQCMTQNASAYSMGGATELAINVSTGTDTNFSSNPIVSAFTGNAINGILFGEPNDSATVAATISPDLARTGMGTVTTFGRRSTQIISLNLAGNGGVPKALSQVPTGGLLETLESTGKVLSMGMSATTRWGIDIGLTAAEMIGCVVPRTD